jgi:hypothetical protein
MEYGQRLTPQSILGKVSIRVTMHLEKKKLVAHFTLGLVFYLLLFSSFALFHAYANNELSNPQGCHIGLWVQHGQATFLTIILLWTVFACSYYLPFSPDRLCHRLVVSGLTARAPPLAFC